MGAFSGIGFGRLIKTVIPGLMLLVTLIGYFDLVTWLVRDETPALRLVAEDFPVVAAIAFPASILLGIMSNMVMFAVATNALIRTPFNRGEGAELCRLETQLLERTLRLKADWLKSTPEIPYDLEYLLAPDIRLERQVFLQDSYWYYLEFQMNTALALLVSSPLVAVLSYQYVAWLGGDTALKYAVVPLVLLAGLVLVRVLVGAARLNYRRHRTKLTSMLVAALHSAELEVQKAEANDVSVSLFARNRSRPKELLPATPRRGARCAGADG